MKTIFTYQKAISKLLTIFSFCIFLTDPGCYTIERVNQPDTVTTNNIFQVTLCVDCNLEFNNEDFSIGHGILGILMPEGWTVMDSVTYKLIPNSNYIQKDGTFIYNDTVVSFLKSNAELPTSGFNWWGGKTSDRINMAHVDSGFVHITIRTNDKTGEFKINYILGDDNEWNIIEPNHLYAILSDTAVSLTVDFSSFSEYERELEDWEIYPNPANDHVYIKQGNPDVVVLKLYDLTGRLQKSEVIEETLNFIDLSGFSKGSYIVSLEKQGKIKTKELIVR